MILEDDAGLNVGGAQDEVQVEEAIRELIPQAWRDYIALCSIGLRRLLRLCGRDRGCLVRNRFQDCGHLGNLARPILRLLRQQGQDQAGEVYITSKRDGWIRRMQGVPCGTFRCDVDGLRYIASYPDLILALGALSARLGALQPVLEEWDRLVTLGDRLAAEPPGPGPVPREQPDTARKAYLLAFHEAQDHEDVARMLLVAERLERLGEAALAAHVREATQAAVRAAGGAR